MLALVQWFTRYILHPNVLGFIVSEISAFIRTDGHGSIDSASDLDQEYIYFRGRKRFLLPVTYFPTQYPNLVYPFTLRVTGITI